MNSNPKANMPVKKDASAELSAEIDSCCLEAFFSLLFKIDKRNHPELYEHNQSGTSPDQASEWPDGIC